VLAAAIAISAGLGLSDHGVKVVGTIPTGLPGVSWPHLKLGDLWVLLPSAAGMMLVIFSEALGAGQTFADKHGYRLESSQEMIALGLANLGSGVLGGLACGGSLSQSAVNDGAGARTEISPVIAAVLSLVTVVALTPLFTDLPEAVLAALIIHAVSHLMKVGEMKRYRRLVPREFWLAMLTLLGVIVLDVLPALIIGVVIALLLLVYQASRPRVSMLGADPVVPGAFADIGRHDGIVPVPGVLIVRPDAPLFYANAELVRDAIEQAMGNARAVVLLLDGNDNLDITSAEQLGNTGRRPGRQERPARPGPRARPGPGDGRTVRAARHGRRRSRLPDHARRRGLGAVGSRRARAGPSGRRGLDVPLFSQVVGLLRFGGQPDALLAVEQPVQAGREHAADQRCHDEQPHLAQGGAADHQGGAKAASRVHRRAGDRDADEVHHGQRQPDGDGGRGRVGGRRGHSQDDEDEQRGQDDLEDERPAQADVNLRLLAPAVGAQAGDGPVIEGRGAERAPQHQRTDDPAGELGDPVTDRLGQRDAPGEQGADGDGGVDVAAGYRPDHVHQRQQGQAERQRGGHHPGRHAGAGEPEAEHQRGHAHGEEHQDRRAKELNRKLPDHYVTITTGAGGVVTPAE
jgi:hypothetical protein